MDTKSWYTSKTIWVNGLAFLAVLASAVGLDLGLTPEVQAEIAVGIIAVVNLVLRYFTHSSIRN